MLPHPFLPLQGSAEKSVDYFWNLIVAGRMNSLPEAIVLPNPADIVIDLVTPMGESVGQHANVAWPAQGSLL